MCAAKLRILATTAAVGLLAGTAPALAQAPSTQRTAPSPARSPWDRGHIAVRNQLGLFTPTGLAGIGVTVAPVRWISLEAGVGMAFSGPQVAGMLRARKGRVSVGAGLSAGPYHEEWGLFEITYKDAERAVWGNLEVAMHFPLSSAGEVRVFLGRGTIIGGDCVKTESSWSDGGGSTSTDDCGHTSLPYGGVGLGWAITSFGG